MTIAGLYLSPEGIVLGADSTSSVNGPNGFHYFNFGQKLFEIGQESTFGILTWGLGGLGPVSYRALVAKLGDSLSAAAPASVAEVADRWVDLFYPEYIGFEDVAAAVALGAMQPYDPADPGAAGCRTAEEEEQLVNLSANLRVGFCVAGYAMPGRVPDAVTVFFEPLGPRPLPQPAHQHVVQWWGMQNVMNRLIYGVDDDTVDTIMQSGHWTGTVDELVRALLAQPRIPRAHLPIRDAIDYVHSAIYCTIKAMKFSNLPQVCGGPIELAVITADRKFRWVRHKPWDAAICDGDFS